MGTDRGKGELSGGGYRPLVTAHRGNSAFAPENTLVAFQQALDLGADGCECDVRATADGYLILMHDATVERTTDGKGAVNEMSLAEIQSLDAGAWKSPAYAGERVPLLRDVMELHVGRGMLYIEIKDYGCVEQVVKLIGECGAEEWVNVCSFSYDACVAARQMNPALSCALIYGGGDELATDELVRRLLVGNLQAVSLGSRIVDEEILLRCRRAGIGTWVWTVDEAEEIARFAGMGLSNIVSNRPELALEVCRSGLRTI